MDVSVDALRVLLLLAPGFVGFRLYMIDSSWGDIRQLDIIYGSLVFSAIGYGFYLLFSYIIGFDSIIWMIIISFISAIISALTWRLHGHTLLHRLLHRLQVTNEDNLGDVWQKIFNDPRIYVTQITAYLKSGEAIQCDNTADFDRPELRSKGIFPYYTHREGQICFVPNLRKRCPNSEWEAVEDVEATAGWGVRMIYIRPDELQRLEVRVTPSKAEI
ncbi:hypothetical protein [Pelagibius sp.]|uniref:hypothetical protein n=1 Tax=Pelagibius sp. TaxID=1931238 RepID=UPI003B50EE23